MNYLVENIFLTEFPCLVAKIKKTTLCDAEMFCTQPNLFSVITTKVHNLHIK